MSDEIKLTIALPSQIYKEAEVASVIIPAVRADVDILPDRAPSVFVLDYGVLQILKKSGALQERYFIKSGMAQVVENHCQVMTQGVIPFDDITPFDAKKKVEEAINENDRLFYSMILDYQRGIRRRYLQTLNVFGSKSGPIKTHEEYVAEIRENLEELRRRFPK